MAMKNNPSYWELRQVQDAFGYYQKAENISDQIAAVYQKASRYLSIASDEIFERYMTKHDLSEAEARDLINQLTDKESIDELLMKLRNATDSSKKELLKQLEAPAYQARLERLRQLQNQMDLIMRNVYQQELNISTSFYTDLANEAYYRNIFNIQQRADAAFSFSCLSANQINSVLNSKWSGENYSRRIWKNTQTLSKTLKEELLVNLITGRTNREVSEIISNKFAQSASNARRLVRTESNFISTEMNFKAYGEAEIEKYQYLATLDLKTSETCRELDGKIFLVKDRKTGINCPPMHPWCRSTTISVIDESLIAKMQRSAIDPATGKRIKVPRSMNYSQWYDKYVKGKPEVELEEKKVKNRSSDMTQYKRYKDTLGEGYLPKNLNEFQNIKYGKSDEYGILKAQVKGMSYYNKAIANEPDITAHVKSVASTTGMRTEGLEFRIKGKESYLRKIASKYDPKGNTYEVKDILRYTYTASPDKLVDKTNNSIETHRNLGYNTIEVKNYWLDKNNPYNGVNTVIKAPNGQKFELQYHTPESFGIKNGEMHKLYEKQRIITDKESEQYIALEDKMFEISGTMKIPNGVEEIKNVR